MVEFFQNTDNIFRTKITKEGAVQAPSLFPQAEYTLSTRAGEVIARLTLGNGISVEDDDFVVHIQDDVITSELRGVLNHQFVVYNVAGDRLPPVFIDRVRIVEVVE